MKLTNLRTVLLIVIVFTLFQCKKSEKLPANNISQFSKYIQAYGPSAVSQKGEIFLHIRPEFIENLPQDNIEAYFHIEPEVEGAYTLRQDNIIVFTPNSDFKSGQTYKVSVQLAKLLKNFEMPSEDFQFSSRIIPQFASFEMKDFYFENGQWNLDVELHLNDKESLKDLQKAIIVKQGNSMLDYSIDFENPLNPVVHIANIRRGKNAANITTEIDPEIIGLEKKEVFNFEIPSTDNFELLKVQDDPANNAVHFLFTQLLNKNQNLAGLIKFPEDANPPKYKVENNRLSVFYTDQSKAQSINISKGLTSVSGLKLENAITHSMGSLDLLPEITAVGIGHIIPTVEEVVFPFEAIGLEAVHVEIFKIYSKNLMQFYQQNTLENAYNLEYVGEVVHAQTLQLNKLSPSFNPYQKKRYFFNLKDFIQQDKNAIYEIRIGFLPEDVILKCAQEIEPRDDIKASLFDGSYYGLYGYYEGYNWNDQDDPCKKAYYKSSRFLKKIVLNSNIGIIAKKSNNGELMVMVNDIITTEPLSEANIVIYNKAQREIRNTRSDGLGMSRLANMQNAYMVKVSIGKAENWIRVQDNDALSVSKFDVGGRTKNEGIDGFLYGERSIWRPGDSMYINFMLHDPQGKIPEKHPVKMIMQNPAGKIVYNHTSTASAGPIYPFIIKTDPTFLTGDYLITAKLGNSSFTKFAKIENIKPNKFSVKNNLDVKSLADLRKAMTPQGLTIDYSVDWLYGAPAKNKLINVEMKLQRSYTYFEDYKDYQFVDPRNQWSPPESEVIAEKSTNSEGKVAVNLKLMEELRPPGKLTLKLKSTAYETSGDFSSFVSNTQFSPYEAYVGLEVPRNQYNSKRIDKDKDAVLKLVSVDEEGKPLGGRKLKAKVWKMENYWWWNSYDDQFDMNNSTAHISQDEFSVSTDNKGLSEISTKFRTYGRYYIQVCDDDSGHCTGDYLYVGYAWDDGRMTTRQYEEAAQLDFTVKETSYKVGSTVELNVPSYFNGKALVSLENGDKVVESFWTEIKRGNNKINFTAQLTMFPTVYAHITMLQAHTDKANDMPIRSYGILPLNIEDSSLKIKPVIEMNESLKPREKYTVQIKEASNKDMYYTLAVVDEGLLNISNFKTPDPFDHFYSKPSLGVRTFDLYNDVMTAYGRNIDKLFSIGGDMDKIELNNDTRANRFRPVVKHIGPFYLEAGAKKTHTLHMPNYIGSVRVMVVAGNKKSFGSVEKNVTVKQDLMVLATLPRQLAPGDKLNVPITMFAMKDNIGSVEYGVQTQTEKLKFANTVSTVNFDKSDEKVERIQANVGLQEGIEKIGFYAKSNNLQATQEIEIAVVNPNPISRRSESYVLSGGESKTFEVSPIGPHESTYSLGVSSLAPVNIGELIDRLARYPYGCLEQRTSAAFALLFQKDLVETTADQELYAKLIITDYIDDLYRFKITGGYALWDRGGYYDSWLTSYVGDFILSAKEKGYAVPQSVLNQWVSDQKALASSWAVPKKTEKWQRSSSSLDQAYRLYTLAKAGKPMLNEMNRMREDYELNVNSSSLLAAAYAIAGRKDIAAQVIDKATQVIDHERWYYYNSFGSYERNLAIQVLMFSKIEEEAKMANALKALNDELKNTRYLATQTSSFVLRALASVIGKTGKTKDFQIKVGTPNASSQTLSTSTGLVVIEDKLEQSKSISLENPGTTSLYVELTSRGKEELGKEVVGESELTIKTEYKDRDGNVVDPSKVKQGTDIRIITTIGRKSLRNQSYKNLVLRQIVPSGWEIINDRIFDYNTRSTTGLEYQDFKDNQVNSFFSLVNKPTLTIEILAKATYPGTFYHPKMLAESMYENDIYAELKGFTTTVEQ